MNRKERRAAVARSRISNTDRHRAVAIHKKTILPITGSIKSVCVLLDEVLSDFITIYRDTPPSFRYEAHREALNLFKIAIRNLEGVIELARHDLILLPPALAAARACFEAAVKAAWLVNADDPFDREARWLVHLASEERYLARMADRLQRLKWDAAGHRQQEKIIREFRLSVETQLPPHIRRLERSPSFDAMLAELGSEALYLFYVNLSQTVHGEHAATWLYRGGGLGTENQSGEFITPSSWFIPLRVGFLSFCAPAQIFLRRVTGSTANYLSDDLQKKIEEGLTRIADGGRPS
jgi:hypothetical protein